MNNLFILSIDVGITNLGYVFANVDEDVTVINCGKVNIKNVTHDTVNPNECCLHHDNCIPDYLDHFIQNHKSMFDTAELIIIERQPPVGGITNVQDLLFKLFRERVLLISPRSVHSYFNMSKSYDTRKIQSERIAKGYLESFKSFTDIARKHDISDAMLMILYYKSTIKKKTPEQFDLNFERFRFYKT